MKRVVSVSLGTSQRDKIHDVSILGEEFRIERRGTDGNRQRFRSLMAELDGKVDALGVGGADIFVVVGDRKYAFRDVLSLIRDVKKTPVVDGSGLKHTLERKTIETLQETGVIDFQTERVLLVSAVDRYGMAQTLDRLCPNVVYGDLMFGLGLPIPVRRYRHVEWIGRMTLPIVTKLPIQWFYPTGEKQETRTPKHKKYFDRATIICGDWHYIRRYAPDRMDGKTIITQTLRKADLEWLSASGAARAITTTPLMGGETFATNVMEGVIVSFLGRRPELLSAEDYLGVLARLNWTPNIIELAPKPENPVAVS